MGVLDKVSVIIIVVTIQLQATVAQNKCGLVPSKIFLPKGEKRQLVFWTDQDYTQVTTVSSVTSSSPTSQEPVDDFLEAVNGNKPSLSEVNNTNQVTDPTSTTTTTTTTSTTTVESNQEIIFITTEQPQLGVSLEDVTVVEETTNNVNVDTTSIETNEETTEPVTLSTSAETEATTISMVPTTSVEIESEATTSSSSTIDNLQNVESLIEEEAIVSTEKISLTTTALPSLLSEEFVTDNDNVIQESEVDSSTVLAEEEELTTLSSISEEAFTTTENLKNFQELTTLSSISEEAFTTTENLQNFQETSTDLTTELNVQFDDSDSVNDNGETATTMISTPSASTTTTYSDPTTQKEDDMEVSSSEDAIVFPDPTLDYEFETTTIQMVSKDPLKDEKVTFGDDVITPVASITPLEQNDDDKVTVVTSMSVENQDQEDDQLAQENEVKEDVVVVTGAALPAKTWDELEVIEEVTSTTEAVVTTTKKKDSIKDNYFMMSLGLDFEDETDSKEATTTESGTEDEYAMFATTPAVEVETTTATMIQTQEPSAETVKISSQDDTPSDKMPLNDDTSESMDTATVAEGIQFDDADSGIDFDPEVSTYFPVANTKRIIDETTTGSPLEIQAVFAETTTGSGSSSSYFPVAQPVIQETIEDQDNPLLPVEPVVSEIDIQDQQETLLPLEPVVVQLDIEEQQETLLPIEPVIQDIIEDQDNPLLPVEPIVSEIDIQDQQETLLPLEPVVVQLDIDEQQETLLPLQPVVAQIDVDEQQEILLPIDPYPGEPIVSETDEVIFQETTTGSPILSSAPLVAPVVVEESDDGTIFEDTTMHQELKIPSIQAVIVEDENPYEDEEDVFEYEDNIPDLQAQAVFAETTTGSPSVDLKMTDAQFDTTEDAFTPAFTTAPVMSQEKNQESMILSPGDIEDMVAKFAMKMTTESIIMDDDVDNDYYDSTTTERVAFKDTEDSATNSAIVDVEALDKGVFYDNDEELSEEDNFIDDTLDKVVTSKSLKSSQETGQEFNEERTTAGSTTVINGFIINRKTISNIISDNDMETVRTGGIVELNEINFDGNQDLAEETTMTMITGARTTSMNTDETTTESTVEVTTLIEDATSYNYENGTEYYDEESIDNSTQNLSFDDAIDNSTNVTETLLEENVTDIRINEVETTSRKPAPFPVTDLLKGIYKLIQGYIPSQVDPDSSVDPVASAPVNQQRLEYFDSPELKPISESVAPTPSRQPQLFVSPPSPEDSFDSFNSNTDPFQQLSAPDLTGLIPDAEREDNVQYVFASDVKKSTSRPITLSPFNSSALKVEEPPKALAPQDRFDKEPEQEEGSFLTAFLPSFLTSSRQQQKPKVAGSLPVTVRDQAGAKFGRRPIINSPQQNKNNFPFLGSLFNNVGKAPSKQGPRPLRPNVPAQKTNTFVNDNGFVPVPTRQRSSPVSIPLPGSVEVDNPPSEKIDTNRLGRFAYFKREAEEQVTLQDELIRFIEGTPLPMRNALLRQESEAEDLSRQRRLASEPVNCTWTIQTERNLYLLMTFQNLSAPFTVDCVGAFIAIERENNGFEAKWCGNRVSQGGSRPYVIFARNEVRVTVFDDGSEGKTLPTGFNGDVEVIDLFDAGEFSSLRKTNGNGYSNVRTLSGKSLI